MNPLKSGNNLLEKALVAFLRDSLKQRYGLDNIRQYEGFNAIPDASVEALQNFGLRYIYPEWEMRQFQDQAFEKLLALLTNPLRLSSLTAVALKSLFRFGSDLPKAIDAGKQVIRTFEATRTLENLLLSRIMEQDLPSLKNEHVTSAVAAALKMIGKAEFEDFVTNMVSLMELLAQRSLLTTGASVLGDIAAAMEKHPKTYDEMERAGTKYAVEVMTEGMALFDALENRAITEAIQTIPEVEHGWFDRMISMASS
jgi:hypothetical protein